MSRTAKNVRGVVVKCLSLCLQVTPSSKVVGDLAQFMVQNDLDEAKLVEKASSLNLPDRSPTTCQRQSCPLAIALHIHHCGYSFSSHVLWYHAHAAVDCFVP